MRFHPLLADENIHPVVVAGLRERGFDVVSVVETGMGGATDVAILRNARQDGRVVLTHDSDFGRLVVQEAMPFVGIVYLRPGHHPPQRVLATWDELFSRSLRPQPPFLWIVELRGNQVRTRLRNVPRCLACRAGTPFERPAVCPACGHVFTGSGWDGIDAHWRAHHEDVVSYEAFWEALCEEHRLRVQRLQ